MEIYQRVRRACHVEGMSVREAARQFGLHRKTVKKILQFSLPPGYQRSRPVRSPKLGGFTAIIDAIPADDKQRPKKQHHSAKRIRVPTNPR
ncbi:MAG: sigma-70 family RNA polymerase sigma factor [Gammaproteobacteria bacterium]|nr:sigma-70 family RNA polymerase sigma factor [Gammaproteobacteria bacterium]